MCFFGLQCSSVDFFYMLESKQNHWMCLLVSFLEFFIQFFLGNIFQLIDAYDVNHAKGSEN